MAAAHDFAPETVEKRKVEGKRKPRMVAGPGEQPPNVARCLHDLAPQDLIAGIEQRFERHIEASGSANAHDDMVGRERDAGFLR